MALAKATAKFDYSALSVNRGDTVPGVSAHWTAGAVLLRATEKRLPADAAHQQGNNAVCRLCYPPAFPRFPGTEAAGVNWNLLQIWFAINLF